jgi:hypothetical protein
MKSKKHERRALEAQTLPYGAWLAADGSEVLFNRSYFPIWSRKDGIVTELRHWRAIDWTRQFYFRACADDSEATIAKLRTVLEDFKMGRPVDGHVLYEQSRIKIPTRDWRE